MSKMLFAVLAAAMLSPATAAEINQPSWARLKQEIVLKNGQRLAYVEWGDPEGAPVVLLHGFTDTSRSWTQVLPALDGFRVIIPDQRGHGASAKPECCYAPADFAYDLKLLMDALKIGRAKIAGHSLGSMIALEFAATYPERVERLVLAASTGLAPFIHGDWIAEGALSLEEPLDYGAGFLAEWIEADALAPLAEQTFLAQVQAEIREIPVNVWRGVARALVGLPVARLAADIDAPVLILAGGADEMFGPEHQAALRAAFPQADYREFDGLGHNLIWEKPELVGAVLSEFLRR